MKFRKLLSAAILFFAAFFVRGVEVVNAGHSGWNSRQLREIFRQELDKNRPDLIILMVGTNDNLNSYNLVPPEEFEKNLTAMAEAAKAVTDHCGDKILYISVANNLSVDCDCDSSPEDPRMGDIGILASLDPVALDRACTDLVRSSEDHGKIHLIERIDSRHGMHTLDYAEQLGMGSQKYELVELK